MCVCVYVCEFYQVLQRSSVPALSLSLALSLSPDPAGKVHGIGDGSREHDDPNMVWQHYQHFLPHHTSLCVCDTMLRKLVSVANKSHNIGYALARDDYIYKCENTLDVDMYYTLYLCVIDVVNFVKDDPLHITNDL